jgi:2-aminoadipate transaminase
MAEAISLARGIPSADLLPAEELAECARAVLLEHGHIALSYGPGGGFGPLREWVGERHGVAPGRVLLTNGSLQGFVLLAQHLLAGDTRRVLVEAPTYDRPLHLLAGMGAEVVPLPLDDQGLDPDALERALDGGPAAFLYAIPTFQNPTGRTLSIERRRRVVERARERGLLVVEDDPYGLVRFGGEPSPTMLELDGGANVVYSSSFSKTVAPGLRVGYLVLPSGLAERLEQRASETYISPALIGEAVLWEFISRGRFGPNVRRVSALLAARRDAMVAALEQHCPDGARFTRPDGGYFVWLELPAGVDERRVVEQARNDGVAVVPGSAFFPADRPGSAAVRLAFSAVSASEIRDGIARLAAVFPALAPA